MSLVSPNLAFAALNLRRNPFGAVDGAMVAELAVVDVGPVRAFLDDSAPERRRAVQIVGPPGVGKSTHLRVLARRLGGLPIWAWSADDGWPPPPSPGDPLLVDDAHLLTRRALVGALRSRRRVGLATQRDLARALDRSGFEVIRVDAAAAVDLARLTTVVERRLEAARRGPGPLPHPGDAHLDALLRRHGSDLRSILSDLYAWIQDRSRTEAA